MARKQKVLREVEEDAADGIPLRAQGKRPQRGCADAPKPDEPGNHWRSSSPEPRQLPESCVDGEDVPSPRQVSRANRYAGYEAVRALHMISLDESSIDLKQAASLFSGMRSEEDKDSQHSLKEIPTENSYV